MQNFFDMLAGREREAEEEVEELSVEEKVDRLLDSLTEEQAEEAEKAYQKIIDHCEDDNGSCFPTLREDLLYFVSECDDINNFDELMEHLSV